MCSTVNLKIQLRVHAHISHEVRVEMGEAKFTMLRYVILLNIH